MADRLFDSVTELSSNQTATHRPLALTFSTVMTSLTLFVIIVTTIVGNVFVIVATVRERNLQNVANHLIISLAVADLLVACLVMPLGAVYEITMSWSFGTLVCDLWTCGDVLCCTASILHLLAIAIDRYWAVTDINYIRTRSAGRILLMIAVVWTLSLVISAGPLLGWKDHNYEDRVLNHLECLVSQDLGYQVFATVSSFYVPLTLLLSLYYRIFVEARTRIRQRAKMRAPAIQMKTQLAGGGGGGGGGGGTVCLTTATRPAAEVSSVRRCLSQPSQCSELRDESDSIGRDAGSESSAKEITDTNDGQQQQQQQQQQQEEHEEQQKQHEDELATASSANAPPPSHPATESGDSANASHRPPHHHSTQQSIEVTTITISSGGSGGRKQLIAPAAKPTPARRRQRTANKKESLEAKRERKAAKTLAIVTGVFIVCWLPFFISAVALPLCGVPCETPKYKLVASVFLWLGWLNSTLNPIIYTVFSPDYRQAFRRILCGRQRGSGADGNYGHRRIQ